VISNSSPTALGISTAFTATVGSGSNVVYQWDFGDGNVTANGATASHTYAAIGVYSVLITATNSMSNITATTRVTITEVPISNLAAYNSSPTALGISTAFTATVGSGSNVVYLWNFGDGSATASGVNVTHTYGAVGVYTASITATNSVSSLAMTTPVVIATRPIANAGPDQIVKSRAPVTLDGSASFDENAFLPLTYGWTQTGGPTVLLSSDTITHPLFTAPAVIGEAQLTFTLVVTNTYGLGSIPDTVVVYVQPYIVFLPVVQK
jgi:PKD repeat protein